jgi:hypothetical protein
MKNCLQKISVALLLVGFGMSLLHAEWVIVDDTNDSAQLVCCKKKKVVRPKPKKVVKKKLTPCDAIPTAKTYPLQAGEKLPPADMKRCISCDRKYGTIGE